jgi:hypothetical protein
MQVNFSKKKKTLPAATVSGAIYMVVMHHCAEQKKGFPDSSSIFLTVILSRM